MIQPSSSVVVVQFEIYSPAWNKYLCEFNNRMHKLKKKYEKKHTYVRIVFDTTATGTHTHTRTCIQPL